MICYKFRLYPNREQQSKLWKHANKLNNLYNYFLNQRIEEYKDNNKSISRKQQQAQLVKLKKEDEALQEIYSQVLQQVPLRLDNTYKAFFKNCKKGQGFPKFRSCKNFFGLCYPQSGYSIQGNSFQTKVYGKIKFVQHRNIKGNIRQVYITTNNNKWFISITTDYEQEKVVEKNKVGIDVGITNLVATSNKKIIKNKTHAKYFDKQINKLKSRRDKQCKKYSNEWYNLSRIIKRLYDVKNRKIEDFLHKVSKNLSSKYDTIFCEDLSLKKMSESDITGINRELRNSQLAKFTSYLQYKTNNLVKVNPRNTSKTCNNCGKMIDMPLYKREYHCTCGYKEDRDINAAKNVFCLGQAILEGACTESLTIQEALLFREE